jgi:hypothetical protein
MIRKGRLKMHQVPPVCRRNVEIVWHDALLEQQLRNTLREGVWTLR